ncbi:MAG: DUF21 domain-containing protein [Dokdonella sp.]|nr:DUF21 domain-containing protein [Dokdonella sp.]MCW5569270.1 DUF21 domain-containing protein [Dokdonella sp.]
MEIAILGALIVLNGLFSMSEIALVTARRSRLQARAERGDSGAAAALALGQDPTRFMSTVQIGITSIGILNGIVGETVLAEPVAARFAGWGLEPGSARALATFVVVATITYFSIVVGELVPKRLGQAHPEAVARRVALPMGLLAMIAKPFVLLLSLSTRILLARVRCARTGHRDGDRGGHPCPAEGRHRGRRHRKSRARDRAQRVPARRPPDRLADGAAHGCRRPRSRRATGAQPCAAAGGRPQPPAGGEGWPARSARRGQYAPPARPGPAW